VNAARRKAIAQASTELALINANLGANAEAYAQRLNELKEEFTPMFADMSGKLDDIKGELESLKDEEEEYLDNMPEGLKAGEKGDTAMDAIAELQSAICEIESAISNIEVESFEEATDNLGMAVSSTDEAAGA
jgi:SMC interacting uncharacterized protein involved in chromosome segregation